MKLLENIDKNLLCKIDNEGIDYCLFEGGYASPSDFLADEADIKKVNDAIKVLSEFRDLVFNVIDEEVAED